LYFTISVEDYDHFLNYIGIIDCYIAIIAILLLIFICGNHFYILPAYLIQFFKILRNYYNNLNSNYKSFKNVINSNNLSIKWYLILL